VKNFLHRAECGVLLLLATACGLGGCVSSGPELSAGKGVQSGGEVIIPLAAANKSQTPIPLRRLEYTVSIDGGVPVTVTRSALATVHSQTVQTLELPVPSAPGAKTYAVTGELVYVPARKFWKVMYDEEIYRPGVSFSFQGEIEQRTAVTPGNAQPAPRSTAAPVESEQPVAAPGK
jgi:hypothetical protein